MEAIKDAVPVAEKTLPADEVTFEEFIEWLDEDTHAELEDGEIIMASPASKTHQDLVVWLTMTLGYYIRRRNLGWITNAPFQIRLRQTDQSREPDLIFLKSENIDRLQDTYLDGPADLIVEIISPESIGRDRGRKFVEYEQEGIPEYWIIDPLRQQAEFYNLGEDKLYHLAPSDADGVYRSQSVTGFWLNVNWLWQDPLPDELDVLRQLGLLQA